MNGSTSAPSSATTNGTRWAIKPEMKWTSRLSRSSLETATAHLPWPAGLGERGGELRAALDRVRAFAGLDLDELGDDLVTLGGGEPGDRGALGVNSETR